MGIYGALSTAVTGLTAQAFALANISGNIANSQTIGYKRIETSFQDLIPDLPSAQQTAGSVLARSESTADIQGDIQDSSIATNMALNGAGFFVVEPAVGMSDGTPQFSNADYYTRRGDFALDKNGFLVNGAGDYLKGLPIDSTTGNVSGSVLQVIKVSAAFLPAKQTTQIAYQLNLPQQPQTPAFAQFQTVGSDLLHPGDFLTGLPPDTPAIATGSTTLTGGDPATSVLNDGDTLTLDISGAPITFQFLNGSTVTGSNIGIDISGTTTIAQALASVESKLQAAGPADAASAKVGLDGTGKVQISLGDNDYAHFSIGAAPAGLGLTTGVEYDPNRPSDTARVDTVSADHSDAFLDQSIAGGAVTVYASNGAPADVQLRWAKVGSANTSGTDIWNLFYMSDSNATGTGTMWTRVPQDFTFAGNGALSPPVDGTPLTGLTVNGVPVGNVTLQFGKGGITQFADPNGTAQVTTLHQNGYAAGQFESVAVDNSGRVVASYSNGEQVQLAQVVTANFKAPNALKRMDGGLFGATADSGEPILSTEGGIMGSSLEASNTDISTEFTRLIVTQQAYAASTKIVTSANDMLQQALDMIR